MDIFLYIGLDMCCWSDIGGYHRSNGDIINFSLVVGKCNDKEVIA